MPIRSEIALRERRLSDSILADLRKQIAAGVPWEQPTGDCRGYADLLFLVKGLFYPLTDFLHDKYDHETLIELWAELREDILREHIVRVPGTRPYAWWREDRAMRRNGETQLAYLVRHKLISASEKKAAKNAPVPDKFQINHYR